MKRSPRVAAIAVAALSALGALSACSSSSDPALARPADITVDFSDSTPVDQPLVGFTHGLSGTDDARVTELDGAFVRSTPKTTPYDRAHALGLQYVLVLSDGWGYPSQNWNGRGAPYNNWPAWETYVREVAAEWRGRDVLFDIWNEPNGSRFWTGTNAQHEELFTRTARILREELGDTAQVAGPSIEQYDPTRIRRFMEAMRASGTRVDVLTWHEFPSPARIPNIESNLRDARANYVDDPLYADVGVHEIAIHETVPEMSQFAPGDIAATLYYLERGGADEAGRACWEHESGVDSCYDHTLDGTLTTGGSPRAAWWMYDTYASGTAGRVRSQSIDPYTVALATSAGTDDAPQIVVGRIGAVTDVRTTPVTVAILGIDALDDVGDASTLEYTTTAIPNTGEERVDGLETSKPREVKVVDGTASIEVEVTTHDAVIITLSR